MNLTVIWCFVPTSVCKGKIAINMLKVLGATVQNLAAWVTRHVGFVYPCLTIHHILVDCVKCIIRHHQA